MTINLSVYASREHQIACADAVLKGARAVGWKAEYSTAFPASTKHVCCWGWRIGRYHRGYGHEVLVMERAYLGDRYKWYSLAWNGLNGRGSFPKVPDDGGERFNQYFGHQIKPWRRPGSGSYVLLIGQITTDMSVYHVDIISWYASVVHRAKMMYKLPVYFRKHPLAKDFPSFYFPVDFMNDCSLAEAFAGAEAVITFNSNTGVEAVLAGIPTVAMDPGSMAFEVAGHSVGDIQRPDRTRWAAELAWKQWRLDEIESGAPFRLEQPC